MKINSKTHGFIDFGVVLFLLFSPTIFSLPHLTSQFTYALAIIHLLLTIFTKFEVGIIKIIPFRVHGTIELIVSIALIAVAFYLQNSEGDVARNFYLSFAVAVFLTWALTDYKTNIAD